MPAPVNKPRLSQNPRDRMGVYNSIDDVPDKYRLKHHEGAYHGRDVWSEFLVAKEDELSISTLDRIEKAGRYWKEHMQRAGQHHALALPSDIENFISDLNTTRKVKTIYTEYYIHIEKFYTWLQWHTAHPHVYHPVLMAAVAGESTRKIWNHKVNQNDKR